MKRVRRWRALRAVWSLTIAEKARAARAGPLPSPGGGPRGAFVRGVTAIAWRRWIGSYDPNVSPGMKHSTSAARRPSTRPASAPPADPTGEQFAAFGAMFAHFNATIFGGELRPVLLNFSRRAKAHGFFAPERWERGATVRHEISLNPSTLKSRPAHAVAATLVHEMVHLWQQDHGKPGRRGYHNAEWAAKMRTVGLIPSTTGAPGGAETGERVTHYIQEGGPFARAFESMNDACRLPWACEEPDAPKGPAKPANKIKYTCPACDANAWGKPGLALVCGDCEEDYEPEA